MSKWVFRWLEMGFWTGWRSWIQWNTFWYRCGHLTDYRQDVLQRLTFPQWTTSWISAVRHGGSAVSLLNPHSSHHKGTVGNSCELPVALRCVNFDTVSMLMWGAPLSNIRLEEATIETSGMNECLGLALLRRCGLCLHTGSLWSSRLAKLLVHGLLWLSVVHTTPLLTMNDSHTPTFYINKGWSQKKYQGRAWIWGFHWLCLSIYFAFLGFRKGMD